MALDDLHEVQIPESATSNTYRLPPVAVEGSDFVNRVTSMMIAGRGDLLPVSALPVDGTFPTDTAKVEKRSIALEIPIWDPDICIECGLCALVCPHAAIRSKAYPGDSLNGAPAGFLSRTWKGKELAEHLMTIQVASEDCTGCGVCVDVCPPRARKSSSTKQLTWSRRRTTSSGKRPTLRTS